MCPRSTRSSLPATAPDSTTDSDSSSNNAENYFTSRRTGKSVKSTAMPDLDMSTVLVDPPADHPRVDKLISSYSDTFARWYFELGCGLNILLYGFGAKTRVVEEFCRHHLQGHHRFLLFDGCHGTLRDLLGCILAWHVRSSQSCPVSRQCDLVCAELSKRKDELFIIVQSLDRISDPAIIDSLCRLATVRTVRLMMTTDHVNSLLKFDVFKLDNLNLTFYNVTTFAGYHEQLRSCEWLSESRTTAAAVGKVRVVLSSLPPNSRKIFSLICKHGTEGVSVRDLYELCRQQFLVGSEVALHSHLTELKDHGLFRKRKDDKLYVTLDSRVLMELTEE